jgi:hypothetical protein
VECHPTIQLFLNSYYLIDEILFMYFDSVYIYAMDAPDIRQLINCHLSQDVVEELCCVLLIQQIFLETLKTQI